MFCTKGHRVASRITPRFFYLLCRSRATPSTNRSIEAAFPSWWGEPRNITYFSFRAIQTHKNCQTSTTYSQKHSWKDGNIHKLTRLRMYINLIIISKEWIAEVKGSK